MNADSESQNKLSKAAIHRKMAAKIITSVLHDGRTLIFAGGIIFNGLWVGLGLLGCHFFPSQYHHGGGIIILGGLGIMILAVAAFLIFSIYSTTLDMIQGYKNLKKEVIEETTLLNEGREKSCKDHS